MSSYYKNVDTDIVENFYRKGIISRKEYREVRVKPNKLFTVLQEDFRKQVNIYKISTSKTIEISGFLHSPPDSILRVFNKHYPQLRENMGYYELLIISPTPTSTNDAWPVIIPITQTDTKKYTHAHFIRTTGRILNLLMFGSKVSQPFIHAMHPDVLGHEDIFQITPPSINTHDVYEMMRDHFTMGGASLNTMLLSIFSSPIYEGRVGGNALSLTTSPTFKYRCPQEIMTQINKDLGEVLSPSHLLKKHGERNKIKPSSAQQYVKIHDKKPPLQYKFNTSIETAVDFLRKRKHTQPIQEINISTTPTAINPDVFNRPVKEIIYKPTKETQVLKYTDLPLLLTHHDININPMEKELYTYALDIQHLIYNSRLHVSRTQINRDIREKTVEHILYQLEKQWPQITHLIRQGIIFDIGLIGGIGEHITRLTHAAMRANQQNTIETATHKAENLYYDILTRICAEIETPARRFMAELEKEKHGEIDRIATGKEMINSVLFELEGLYPDGWSYEMFEVRMKKRTAKGVSRIIKSFEEVKQRGWVSEVTPGLFKTVTGIDRYL
ncbi:MAG: hypothetical protein L6408_06515 [Nanoarchaeota archaeon]|nr:hypothetical protein [Nanoarchaeota archaeon]